MAGLWLLLAAAVGCSFFIFLAGQVALCGARRVSRTQVYQRSMQAVRHMGSRQVTRLQRAGTGLGLGDGKQGGGAARYAGSDLPRVAEAGEAGPASSGYAAAPAAPPSAQQVELSVAVVEALSRIERLERRLDR